MVFTLVCTWIGSGTFIAGAEYAARAGWSSLWLPAGAWVGIAVIYFLAAKIRTFGQYTVGDILEVRYGKFARLFGAIALVIAFTTIVSYQFRAGGYILNVATDGAISVEMGQVIAAAFVILFTSIGGMVAVAHTDLPNGIIIVLACCAALPFVVLFAGGWSGAAAALPPQHFAVFAADFGRYPALKAGGYFLATLLLLMGIQSMYQKFYSAKSPGRGEEGRGLWIVGTIVVETVVVVIAIYAASAHWADLQRLRHRRHGEGAGGHRPAAAGRGRHPRPLARARRPWRKARSSRTRRPRLQETLQSAFAGRNDAAAVADAARRHRPRLDRPAGRPGHGRPRRPRHAGRPAAARRRLRGRHLDRHELPALPHDEHHARHLPALHQPATPTRRRWWRCRRCSSSSSACAPS